MFTKNRIQSIKKILSLYMVVLMVAGLFPTSSFAQTQNDTVTVTLTVNGQSHRGVLLGEQFTKDEKIVMKKGQTVREMILDYCNKHNVKYGFTGDNYLNSLHGLTEKEYGDLSGWTYHVWDTEKKKYYMPDLGVNEYKLERDENIKFVYQIDNFWWGYEGEKKKAADTARDLLTKIDKKNMSGYLAAMLYNTGGDVPAAYKNTARSKVAALKESSSLAQFHEVILAVLASGENPYAAWGRNLIAEVAKRDVLNASIDEMIYAIAIVKAGDFKLPAGTSWDVKKVQTALKAKQNPDGSFGEGSDIEKVIRTARVYNFVELEFFSKEWNKVEDYLANQMHDGGGLPASKEDYFATAELVLAMSNRSKDPNGLISYRVTEKWNKLGKPSPYKALLDFYIGTQNGFKRDYLDKKIDPSIEEIGTLAIVRTDKLYNDKQFAGKSLFKFGEVKPPSNTGEGKLWIDKTYEEIVAREKANAAIKEESAYILKRMGEELSDAQIKALEGKIKPDARPFQAYKAVLASITLGNGKEKENIAKVMEEINKAANSRYNSPNSSAWVVIAAYGTKASLSAEKANHIREKLLAYTLFQPGKDIKPEDKHIYFAGAITLMDEKTAQSNYAKNIEKLIQSKTGDELSKRADYIPNLVTALNLLGEDIFDAKYTSKDGNQLVSMLQAGDIKTDAMFFALASYKLKQQDGSNIFQYSFGKSTDEKIQDTIEKFVDKADLQAYVLKKYDDRDVSTQVVQNKAEVVKKNYKLMPRRDVNLYFNLMAGGENLQNVDGHNLIDGITEKESLNSKVVHINSLLILNSADYKTNPSHPESKETFKSKVLQMKEFRQDGQGQYMLSDVGSAMMALAPYYKAKDAETVKTIDAFLVKLHQSMKNDGTIAPFGQNIQLALPYHSHNQAAIVEGLVYLGIDPHTDARCIKNGKSLVDGLYTFETKDGFAMDQDGKEAKADSTYTRAALTALIDYQLFKQNKKQIYDYSDIVKPPSNDKTYDVTFEITPAEAKDAKLLVTEKGKSDAIAADKNVYKLKAGEYTVQASKDGYEKLTKDFTVTAEPSTHVVKLELKKAVESPFEFDKATQTIIGYKNKDVPQELEIPAQIDGVAVKKIGKEAFKYSSNFPGTSKVNKPITKLTLPEGLETIEDRAFQGNIFTEIKIPSTVKEINGGFMLCKQLEKVDFAADSILEIVGKDAFNETAIKEIQLPNTVQIIGESAFHSSTLEKIYLPEGLKEIQTSAFALTKVQEITLPKNIEKLNLNKAGKEGNNGLFYRTFADDAKKELAFTRVKDESGKATIENTRGVVNPVEVSIKYVNKATKKEIVNMPSIQAVGINKKIVTDFGKYATHKPTIGDGDNKLLMDYKNPYTSYKVYSDKETALAVIGNYFAKNSEWTFDAPDIAGYNKPASVKKTLTNDKEEVVFEYAPTDQKFKLKLDGVGLTSEPKAGELEANTEVQITVTPPANKTFKKLLLNNKEVQPTKDGVLYKYSFKITEDTTVSVEYEDANYNKEIQVQAEKTELKLGEKTKVKVQYRGQDIMLPNKDIVVEFDKELLSLDEKTGEVTAIGSGTVVLSVRLKNQPSTKDEVSFDIKPIMVSVRIEDVNETLYKPTQVKIDSLKVKKGVDYYEDITFKNPNAFLAVKNLLQAKGKDTSKQNVLDFDKDGNWMKVIDSLKPTTKYGNNASFMFAVNDTLADKGAGYYEIKDGDAIIIYVTQDWNESDGYVYFEKPQYQVKAGEELSVKLLHQEWNMKDSKPGARTPFKDATLLNDTVVLKDKVGKEIISNDAGEFKVTFAQKGTYHLSAQKIENGVNRISRPYAIVEVTDETNPGLSIRDIDKIQDIQVEKGTERAKLPLPSKVSATLSDNSKTDLTLTWDDSTPPYDAEKGGEYIFEASYDLPTNVSGNKPQVTAKVIVKDPSQPSLDEVLQWAKQKHDAIIEEYASREATNDWWKIAELGSVGKEIKPKDLEFIKENLIKDGELVDNTGLLLKSVLALRAAGIDPENYYGHNVVEKLVNAGEGSSVWVIAPKLWALSSDDYKTDTSKEIDELIGKLLSSQGKDGLWHEYSLPYDTTGSAIYALAPYYVRGDVQEAIGSAMDAISENQLENGDLTAHPGNLNSLVMVAGGLWSIDSDYLNDPQFVKGKNTFLHAMKLYDVPNQPLLRWQIGKDIGFDMATEQGLRALITYFNMSEDKNRVFDYRGTPKRPIDKDALTIESIDKIDDIVVPFGTKREEIALPAKATLNLSDKTKVEVDLTWADSEPSYDGAKAGEYLFTAQYELPAGVQGAKQPIWVKVIVEDGATIIDSIQEILPIEVEKGTEEAAAIAKLPKTTLIKDNKGNFHSVTLNWMLENYDKDKVGEYKAVGTFDLPNGVEQSNPPTELAVKTAVKIVDANPQNPVDKEALKKLIEDIEKDMPIKDEYTEESYENFEKALAEAKKVADDDNASQDQINQALVDLKNAKAGLKKKLDSKALQEQIEKAKTKLADKAKYEEAGVKKLEEELAKAEALLQNPSTTQAQLDEQAKTLEAVIAALKEKSSGGGGSGGSTPSDIRVHFTLKSIERGGTAEQIWISRTQYTIPENSKVRYVFEKALNEHNIEFQNSSGNYVSTIKSPVDGKWFGEFDNGPNSGWMYMVNGKHPNLGLNEYYLKNNDEIVWHYTNDYTKEEGSEKWNTPGTPGGGGTGGTTGTDKKNETPIGENPTPLGQAEDKKPEGFVDVAPDKWYAKAIQALAQKGLLKGRAGNKFGPNEKITRAEFVAILARIDGINIEEQEGMTFSDVKKGAWYYHSIAWATANNIAKGYGKEFKPNAFITREEMAAMLLSYSRYNSKIKLESKMDEKPFADQNKISPWAKESVMMMQKVGIVGGKENNRFAPKDNATRAEVAEMIYRMVG